MGHVSIDEGLITKRDHERAQHQPLWHSQGHCTQEGESNRHRRNLLSPHIECLLKVTLHADCVQCKSAILYSCFPLHQDLYIPSDKHVTHNGKRCPLLAELRGFRVRHALFWDVFLYLCLIELSIKGDEMTRGQQEKV